MRNRRKGKTNHLTKLIINFTFNFTFNNIHLFIFIIYNNNLHNLYI